MSTQREKLQNKNVFLIEIKNKLSKRRAPVHLDFLDASSNLCTLIEVDQFHARTTPILVAILNECEVGLVQTKIRNARRLKTLQI